MPDTAFLILTAGIGLAYCELLWPGKIIFAAVGVLLALTAIAIFLRAPHSSLMPLWLMLAFACFALDAFVRTWFIASLAGAALFAHAFANSGVSPQLLYPGAVILGIVSAVLSSIARRARFNKRADL